MAAETALRAGARREPGWHWRAAAAAILHDEPGRRGDRQCDRSDSAARRDRFEGTAPLSGDRASKRYGAWRTGAGAGPMTNGRLPAIKRLHGAWRAALPSIRIRLSHQNKRLIGLALFLTNTSFAQQ